MLAADLQNGATGPEEEEEEIQSSNIAAFRSAEKVYRLNWQRVTRDGHGSSHDGTTASRCRVRDKRCVWVTTAPDLSHVLDLAGGTALPSTAAAVRIPCPQNLIDSGLVSAECVVHELLGHPGAFHLAGALSERQQLHWARTCLEEAIEPPATTNHTCHGSRLTRLWHAAMNNCEMDSTSGDWMPRRRIDGCDAGPLHGCDAPVAVESSPLCATSLFRQLRWAALGTPYDWTARSYAAPAAVTCVDGHARRDVRPVPPAFCAFADAISTALCGQSLRGDVALVNLYGTGSTLSGHVDDAEAGGEETAPVVALSLGCPAILLLQNTQRGDHPAAMRKEETSPVPAVTPLLLRSGDVLLLSGQARRARHGVPRVFTPGDAARSPLSAQTAATEALLDARQRQLAHLQSHLECGAECTAGADDVCVSAWLQHHRLNISIRDLEPSARVLA